MKKIVLVDIDDTLWGLNRRVAERAGISYENLNCFRVADCKLITEEEKEKVLSLYGSTETFLAIPWYSGVERLSELESEDVEVRINSNSMTEDIAAAKKEQLGVVLPWLSEEKMTFGIVGKDTCDKKVMEDPFLFLDDSPFNVKNSKAEMNFMIKTPYNSTEEALAMIEGKPYRMFDTFEEMIEAVKEYLKDYEREDIERE